MKSCTDLGQSKKLSEILSPDSADMEYMFLKKDNSLVSKVPFVKDGLEEPDCPYNMVPCWSLAALLDVLPDSTDIVKDKADTENEKYMCTVGVKHDIISTFGNNPVDACYDMITNLHKLSLL